MNFGEKIKMLRIEKGWTQDFVAQRLKISVPALSRYESGLCEPKSLLLVSDFAKLYNVTSDYLLGLDEKTNTEIDSFTKWYNEHEHEIDESDKKMFINFLQSYLNNKKEK